MAGAAAGGFLTRGFESMLKVSFLTTKKYPDLHKAIQSCIVLVNLKVELKKKVQDQAISVQPPSKLELSQLYISECRKTLEKVLRQSLF